MTDHPTSASRSDAAAVAGALGKMFACFRERSDDAVAMVRVYSEGLASLPAWAVVRSCEAFAKGQVPDRRNADFSPSAASVHAYAAGLVAEDERHRRLLDPPRQLPPPQGPSRAERARIGAGLDAYASELKATTIDHEAEKRREVWREMGPRLWERFGHDPSRPWKPSSELEEIIRSKPPSKAEREAA